MPDEHHAAARPRDRGRLLEARAGAHAVKYTVEAAKQQLAAADDRPACANAGDPRALDVEAIGRADVVGAEAARGGLLAGVLGDGRSAWRRARASRTAASVSSPIVPAPMIATCSPGWMSAIARRVQRAGERLDQHGVLVGEVVGHGVQLRLVGDEALAPAAAGLAAEAGLQARGDVAVGRVAAQRAAGPARTRGRAAEAAGGAAERGLDDDALAAARAGADLAHDLVAGDERAST